MKDLENCMTGNFIIGNKSATSSETNTKNIPFLLALYQVQSFFSKLFDWKHPSG